MMDDDSIIAGILIFFGSAAIFGICVVIYIIWTYGING